MTEINPFAAPQSDWAAHSYDPSIPAEVWRAGKVLVFTHGAILPERCIKCNASANLTMQPRKLSYYPQWVLLLILVSLPVCVIVALIMRKTSTAALGLCDACRRRRRNGILLAWLCVLGGLACLFSAALSSAIWPRNPDLVILVALITSTVLFVAGIVIGIVRGQLLTVKKIDKQQVRLTRIASAYLDMLPIGP